MLSHLLTLQSIELSLITTIFFVVLRLFFKSKIKTIILRVISYLYKNNELLEKEVQITSLLDKYNKQIPYVLVFLFLVLFLAKILNTYFTYSLLMDIDSFVTVYNFLKNSSFYLLFIIKNKFKKPKK